jgi:hypothetical protein
LVQSTSYQSGKGLQSWKENDIGTSYFGFISTEIIKEPITYEEAINSEQELDKNKW